MDVYTSDGVKLNYQAVGNGQPVVLIHGFGGYQQIWNCQVNCLAEHGYRVITYDQRGHGASTGDLSQTDMPQLVADLQELLASLDLQQVILIGHSMGASVVYGALQEPRVTAAIAIDQSPKMLNSSTWPYGFMNATRANYRLVLKQLNAKKETFAPVPDRLRWQLKTVRQQFPFDYQRAWHLLRDHALRDWRTALTTTRVPVLLVTGRQSPFFDGNFAQVMVAQNPALISRRSIDRAGHDVMVEEPAAFNQAMLAFLKDQRQ